jgi:hypothetical protein
VVIQSTHETKSVLLDKNALFISRLHTIVVMKDIDFPKYAICYLGKQKHIFTDCFIEENLTKQ